MKLIPDWRKAWRMHSVQVAALGTIVSTVWGLLPPDIQSQAADKIGLDQFWKPIALTFIGVIVARLKAQTPKDDKEDPQ